MLVLFMGPTACGKTSLLNALCASDDRFTPVVRCTTRPQRFGEKDGKDYIFLSVREFKALLKRNRMLEFEEYSGERFYGTLSDSLKNNKSDFKCSTITPSGLMKVCSAKEDYGEIAVIYCTCSLGEQIIRYVSRVDDFDVNDKMELCDRLARDEGMFKGIQSLFDMLSQLYVLHPFNVLQVDTEQPIEYCVEQIREFLEEL